MKNIFFITFSICLISGCITTIEPKVESTKPWEQHYKSVEEFKRGTNDITLDKDESIWVISNKTLNRLLLNIK